MDGKQYRVGTMLTHLLFPNSGARDVGQHRLLGAMQTHVNNIAILLFVDVKVGTVAHREALKAETQCFEA